MISFSRRVSLCLWAYLMIAFPPFLILYLMGALTVGDDTIITLSKQTPTLTTMVVMSFVLPALGAVFSGKKTLILPWKLTLSELGKISALSVVLSFILWKFLHALSPWGVWGLFTLIIIFIFFLPQAGRFISSIEFDDLKELINTNKKRGKFLSYTIPIVITVFFLLTIQGSVVGVDHGIRIVERQILFQSHHPHIDHISPQIGYYSTKVILTGRRFGWKGTVDTEFKKKDGKINIDLWTDTKIIFTIPLNWKLGKINAWAEKTIEWDGKPLHIKSNLVEMKLISRDNGWDAEDDEYFKQMEVADPEARKINGYE